MSLIENLLKDREMNQQDDMKKKSKIDIQDKLKKVGTPESILAMSQSKQPL